MAEEAKVCEHTETELKYDVNRGGHYVQCPECGEEGSVASEPGLAREAWDNMLRWRPKREALHAAEQKAASAQLADVMGLTAGVQGQLDIGRREAAAAERQAAASERIAVASERQAAALDVSLSVVAQCFEQIAAALEQLARKP